LFLFLLVSGHLISIHGRIIQNQKILAIKNRLHKTSATATVTAKIIGDPKDFTYVQLFGVMSGEYCVKLTRDAAAKAKQLYDLAQQYFANPPAPVEGCDTADAPKKILCDQYAEYQMFLASVQLDQDPDRPEIPKEITDVDADPESLIELGDRIAVVDDIIVAVGVITAVATFISKMVAWFKPAELSPEQQDKINSWSDYARTVIDIAKVKLGEYKDILSSHSDKAATLPPESVKSLQEGLAILRTTLKKLTETFQRVLGLLDQCKVERAREFHDAGGIIGAIFSAGISYAAWWDQKNKRINGWQDDAVRICGVDVLGPRISAVRAAMDSLHSTMSSMIFKILDASVTAPNWGADAS